MNILHRKVKGKPRREAKTYERISRLNEIKSEELRKEFLLKFSERIGGLGTEGREKRKKTESKRKKEERFKNSKRTEEIFTRKMVFIISSIFLKIRVMNDLEFSC